MSADPSTIVDHGDKPWREHAATCDDCARPPSSATLEADAYLARHPVEPSMADVMAQLEAIRASIATAEATIDRIAETVGPLVDKLSTSPLIRMIGGK